MRFCVHGLDSYRLTPDGDIVFRFANGGDAPGGLSCGLGQSMSGVIVSMRRTLLSCTSLARNGLIALGVTAITGFGAAVSSTAARADELTLLKQISILFELNHQEFAVLTTALALLGFSVVSAILLMHTRVRATKTEAQLRSGIQAL